LLALALAGVLAFTLLGLAPLAGVLALALGALALAGLGLALVVLGLGALAALALVVLVQLAEFLVKGLRLGADVALVLGDFLGVGAAVLDAAGDEVLLADAGLQLLEELFEAEPLLALGGGVGGAAQLVEDLLQGRGQPRRLEVGFVDPADLAELLRAQELHEL